MIKARRWHWTRSGRLVFVVLVSNFDPGYSVLGLVDGLKYASFTSNGRFWAGMVHDFDLVCEPASRERIVFPHPSTCPRWYDTLKRERKEAEEVLFD